MPDVTVRTILSIHADTILHAQPTVGDGIIGLATEVTLRTQIDRYKTVVPIVLPDPPATPVPGSIPPAGGLIVRALHSKVIDMATPTIVDGKPT